jgi:hypothetical protein
MFSSIVVFLFLLKNCQTSHFRGGTISWAPVNPYATGSPIQVQITTRFYYRYGLYACNNPSQIGTTNQVGDGYLIYSQSGPAWSIQANVFCSDFSIPFQWQAGTRTQTVSIVSTQAVNAAFSSW